MDDIAREELTALRAQLQTLADWADDRLDDDHDRQYIAEHLCAVLDALLANGPLPAAPF